MPKLAILRSRTKVYDIEKRITKIGRGTDNDLILTSSQSISKRHARIEFEESKGNINRDRASLIDLQSRNASFVNKQRIHNSNFTLCHGDIIRFGFDTETFRFEFSHLPPIDSPVKQIPLDNQKFVPQSQPSTARDSRSETPLFCPPSHPHHQPTTSTNRNSQPTQHPYTPGNFPLPLPPYSPHNHQLEQLLAKNQFQEVELAKLQTEQKVVFERELERLRRQLAVENERSRHSDNIDSSYLSKALQSKIQGVEAKIAQLVEMHNQAIRGDTDIPGKSVVDTSLQNQISGVDSKISQLLELQKNENRMHFSDTIGVDTTHNFQDAQLSVKILKSLESIQEKLDPKPVISRPQSPKRIIAERVKSPKRKITTNSQQIQDSKQIEQMDSSSEVKALKEYIASLQNSNYKFKMMIKEKNKQLDELVQNDWAKALFGHKDEVERLEKQISTQANEYEMLCRAFSQLQSKVDASGPERSQTNLSDFVKKYTKRMRHEKAKIQEMERRQVESKRRWGVLSNQVENLTKENRHLTRSIQHQHEKYELLLNEKGEEIVQLSQQLAELSGLESEEKQLAATFLIEKLQAYMGENESLKLQIEELEGEISLSRSESSQIQHHNPEELQRLRDELTELKQNDGCERVAKLESTVMDLQNKKAIARRELAELKEECARIVSTRNSVDEGDMFSFLSESLRQKDQTIKSYKKRNKEMEVEFKVISQRAMNLENQLKQQTSEIETIKLRHREFNAMLLEPDPSQVDEESGMTSDLNVDVDENLQEEISPPSPITENTIETETIMEQTV